MVTLIYAGTFPEQVSALVVLDGVTVLPDTTAAPAHERIAKYVGQLDKLDDREPRRYRTIEEAAAQMMMHNKRLSPELAQHLATFAARRNADISAQWRRTGYRRMITSRSGRASLARRCCSARRKASCPAPKPKDWRVIFGKRAAKPFPARGTGCITTSPTRFCL
jgi:pimeloyl-ACP methyl ester carboxylesterase